MDSSSEGASGPERTAFAPAQFASAFLKAAGLAIEEVSGARVVGHIHLGPEHHTPWGIVHGGVYSAAVESATSIGACAAVSGQGQVAVGLTNTTHFLRSLTGGTVRVEATALYQGRSHQLWRAEITDEPGRLVAHGEVRLQNVPVPPPTAPPPTAPP
ncbi:MAG: PaaI family thioesterase, partial [Acidimicrobiales bacterium]